MAGAFPWVITYGVRAGPVMFHSWPLPLIFSLRPLLLALALAHSHHHRKECDRFGGFAAPWGGWIGVISIDRCLSSCSCSFSSPQERMWPVWGFCSPMRRVDWSYLYWQMLGQISPKWYGFFSLRFQGFFFLWFRARFLGVSLNGFTVSSSLKKRCKLKDCSTLKFWVLGTQ